MVAVRKTAILCILDGWGYRTQSNYNPILQENTPIWDEICRQSPQSFLEASGTAVGLPAGQMGNSEVGHLNLGAGRVVYQNLSQINDILTDNFLEQHDALNNALNQCIEKKTVHIIGLLSEGGVHSHQNHFVSLANYIQKKNKLCKIHAFTDGRDCQPQSAQKLFQKFHQQSNVPIVTLSGRFFGMDRDTNWERTLASYQAICFGNNFKNHPKNAINIFSTTNNAIADAYTQDVSDEFIPPTIIGNYTGMEDGDIIIMANFRADRMRQLTTLFAAITEQTIPKYPLPPKIPVILTLTPYSTALTTKTIPLFIPTQIPNTLGEFIATHNKTQLRLAETEKYAHVTYFFNGGKEEPYPQEDRVLVPSPKVKTYDLQPEMSAFIVTKKLCHAIASGTYDLIIINYANPDMVGHTGNMLAAKKAVATIDQCLGKLIETIDKYNAEMLLTADHGNIEIMFDENANAPHTAHTCNLVQLTYYGKRNITLKNGVLADIAPSLLMLMGLPSCKEMTGTCLIKP